MQQTSNFNEVEAQIANIIVIPCIFAAIEASQK
jgi:hypothetical protein